MGGPERQVGHEARQYGVFLDDAVNAAFASKDLGDDGENTR